jgi:hypothetical protein
MDSVTLDRAVCAHVAKISFLCREQLGRLCHLIVQRKGLLGSELS